MNYEFEVNLNNVADVKKFVEIAQKHAVDIFAMSKDRKHKVDAKSLLGLFSLDLSNPIIIGSDERLKGFSRFKIE